MVEQGLIYLWLSSPMVSCVVPYICFVWLTTKITSEIMMRSLCTVNLLITQPWEYLEQKDIPWYFIAMPFIRDTPSAARYLGYLSFSRSNYQKVCSRAHMTINLTGHWYNRNWLELPLTFHIATESASFPFRRLWESIRSLNFSCKPN